LFFMALKNKYFTEKLVLFFLILTTIGLLSGCAFPPADDVPSDPVVDNPIIDDPVIEDPVDEPTQPTNPGEIDDPKGPELKDPNPIDKDSEDPIDTKPIEPALEFKRAFYVSNSGDDSKNGLTPETAWRTIARVNKQVLEPGDAVLFEKGSVWVGERLQVSSSGTAENRIIYSAYGEGAKPIISGMRTVTGWYNAENWVRETGLGSNMWSIRYSSRDNIRLWIDGIEQARKYENNKVSAENQFHMDGSNNILYIYSKENPAKLFTSLETSGNGWDDFALNKDYITLHNLELKGWHRIRIHGSSYWIIDNCDIGRNAGSYGIQTYKTKENNLIGWIVRNNKFDTYDRLPVTRHKDGVYNTADALVLNQGSIDWRIHDNYFAGWGHTALGMRTSVGDTEPIEGVWIYNNEFTNEGMNYGRAISGRITAGLTNENNPVKIFNNKIIEQGVQGKLTFTYAEIFNNIWHITRGVENDPDQSASAFTVTGGNNAVASHMKIYNNIFAYAGDRLVQIPGYPNHQPVEHNIFRNNIFYESSGKLFRAGYYGNEQINSNIFENNIFWKSGDTNIIEVYARNFDVNGFNNIESHIATNNGGYNPDGLANPQNFITSGNLNVDPMFVDPENGDFRLKAGSPAIGAGINVGLTHDYEGNLYKSTPSIGPFEFYP
jgi:hypothetical protein